MTKNQIFKILHLAPEYICIFLILEKLFNLPDVILYSSVTFFLYFVVSILQDKGISRVKRVLLYSCPMIIVLIPVIFTLERFGVTCFIVAFTAIRIGYFYNHKFKPPYSSWMFGAETIIILCVMVPLFKSFLIFYIVFLKLLLLIETHITSEEKREFNGSEKSLLRILILLALAVPLFYIFPRVVSETINRLSFLKWIIIFPAIVYGVVRGSIMEAFLQLWNKYIPIIFSNKIVLTLSGIFCVCMITASLYFVLIFYIIPELNNFFLHKGVKGDIQFITTKDGTQYEEKVEEIKSEEDQKRIPISEIRKLYKMLLKKTIQKGYILHNRSTARELNTFLIEKTGEPALTDEINRLYENDRYSKVEETTSENFKELYKKLKVKL